MLAFDRLVKSGKARFIGASNFFAWRMQKSEDICDTNGYAKFCCIQTRFSYFRPAPESQFGLQIPANEELFEYCVNNNITLLAYSPLLSGSYGRKDRILPEQYTYRNRSTQLSVLNEVAEEIGVNANQVVLAWMLANSIKVIPVIGVSSREQLLKNLQAEKIKFSNEQLRKLNEMSDWKNQIVKE